MFNVIWQHKNGNRYKVLLIANEDSTRQDDYPTTVVYQNIANRTVWARKLTDWHRSMHIVEITKD
jgi:hypothetical protein